MRQRDLGFLPFFSRFLAFLKVGGRSDHLLPNVARDQLRHTPKWYAFFIIAEFGGIVKKGKQNILVFISPQTAFYGGYMLILKLQHHRFVVLQFFNVFIHLRRPSAWMPTLYFVRDMPRAWVRCRVLFCGRCSFWKS